MGLGVRGRPARGAGRALRRPGALGCRRSGLSSEMSPSLIRAFKFWLPSPGPSVTVPNGQLKSGVGRSHVRVLRGGPGPRVGLTGGGPTGSKAFAMQFYGDQLSPCPVPRDLGRIAFSGRVVLKRDDAQL